MKNLYLTLIYAFAAILLFPVAAYYLEVVLGYGELPPERFWAKVRVLLSGPGLTVLGLLLIIAFKKAKMHLASGIVILFVGLLWTALIIRGLFFESASA